jgi:hypothetical protein
MTMLKTVSRADKPHMTSFFEWCFLLPKQPSALAAPALQTGAAFFPQKLSGGFAIEKNESTRAAKAQKAG